MLLKSWKRNRKCEDINLKTRVGYYIKRAGGKNLYNLLKSGTCFKLIFNKLVVLDILINVCKWILTLIIEYISEIQPVNTILVIKKYRHVLRVSYWKTQTQDEVNN